MKIIYLTALGMYLSALFLTCFQIFLKERSFKIALLTIPSIFMTHLVYGILFIKGFLTKDLKSNTSKV